VFAAIAAATVVAAVVWRPSGGAGSHARRALLLGGAPPVLTVTAVQSHAVGRFGLALQVGDRLPAGTVVRTGKHGRLTLLTREGSEFTLNEKSEFALSPDGVSGALRRGEVYCRSRLHEIRRIATPAGEIHLLGTALDAALTQPDTVAVTVVEGKVRLANSHGEAIVEAGRKAVLTTAQAPAGGVPVDPAAEIS